MHELRASVLKRALTALCLLLPSVAVAGIPSTAQPYRDTLIKTARLIWGLDAPVSAFGAQIQQESAWNPKAHSAYAAGLAEFTPETAAWIAGAYPIGTPDPYDAAWAMRALITYDRDLWKKITADTDCDHMAFVLAAYNGGPVGVTKGQALAKARGLKPGRWFGYVDTINPGKSAANWKQNYNYPRRILLMLEPLYITAKWGIGVCHKGGSI